MWLQFMGLMRCLSVYQIRIPGIDKPARQYVPGITNYRDVMRFPFNSMSRRWTAATGG